ncbi:hypothetical protein YC2023_037217 [Brassica napus]
MLKSGLSCSKTERLWRKTMFSPRPCCRSLGPDSKSFVSVDRFPLTPRLGGTVSTTQQLYSSPRSNINNYLTTMWIADIDIFPMISCSFPGSFWINEKTLMKLIVGRSDLQRPVLKKK